MIDTHCHLSYGPLFDQIDAVLQRAQAVGVRHIISIGTRLDDCLRTLDLSRRFAQVSAAVGIHPHYAAEVSDDELERVAAMFSDPDVIAAGEMGLDYHYDFSPRQPQRKAFQRQLAAATASGKPVILHCREAVDDALAILKEAGHVQGVFHCFTGQMDEAIRILDAGYYLGFTGIITFKNTGYLREIVKMVPADRLLIETDAPYLSPEPHRRQKTNEPSLIEYTFRKAAEVRGVSLGELVEQTTANAQRLFSLKLG